MAWYDDLLENAAGMFGGGMGKAAVGGLMDLLGLGGKPHKEAMPKRPAQKLDMTPMQAPQVPAVPFQPPPLPQAQPAAQGTSPNMQRALDRAMAMMVRGR